MASGTETSLNELAAALLRVMGSNLAPEYGPERKVNPVSRRLADTSKAERLLGFEAQVGLEEGLARLVDWWQRLARSGRRHDPDHQAGDGRARGRRPRAASSSAAGSPRARRSPPSSASSPRSSARRTPARCRTARPRCTWRCSPSASARATRSITVSHSFIATANAIRYCGATPVFVDIEPDTFNIDPALIEAAITPRTRAILCVHQMGMPCDLAAILAVARAHGAAGVEDAACAIGSEILWDGRWERIGRPHGDIACFSFHPRKVMSTGDGGMITTANAGVGRAVPAAAPARR